MLEKCQWRIHLFGGLRAVAGDRVLTHFGSQRNSSLLAYLAFHQDRPQPRERLATLLWPDADPQAASGRLRTCLAALRRLLEPAPMPHGAVLEADRLFIKLSSRSVITDVAEFESALAGAKTADGTDGECEWLERAVSLYGGDLLAGLYDEWVFPEQARLSEQHLQALERLVERLEADGKLEQAAEYASRWVCADPANEAAHRALMRLQAALGRPAAAVRQFRHMEALLEREGEEGPSRESRLLMEQIRGAAGSAPGRYLLATPNGCSAAREACPSLPPLRADLLPRPLTRFIGRDAEIAELAGHLGRERLVTLTGAGGSGKTRLAVEFGGRQDGQWPDGVLLVELASLKHAARVPDAVVAALGLLEMAGPDALDSLLRCLRSRRLLLILDNCEHLLDACAALVASLLPACPGLRVLATSREPLRVPGEQVYRVPSLPAPEIGETPDLEEAAQYASVALFVDRAGLSAPGFELTAANMTSVCRICRRLDGMPLALELAAARVRTMTAEQMEGWLDDRFALLSQGSRTAPARHQTLRAMLDWSYELLAEPERSLLRRLSVFAGGWTLDGAQAVHGCAGVWVYGCTDRPTHPHAHTPPLVLDLLTCLVDKSLVVFDGREDEGRYRLLETVRQYAGEKLEAQGEAGAARSRHSAFYRLLAEQAEPCLIGPEQSRWLRILDAELDNVRAALAWELEGGSPDAALEIATALWQFWVVRGHMCEGVAWIDKGLERVSDPGLKARALIVAADLEMALNLRPESNRRAGQALALARQLGDRFALARLLAMQPHLATPEDGVNTGEELIALCRELGDRWGLSCALQNLGNRALVRCCNMEAAEYYGRFLTLAEEAGDDRWMAVARVYLAKTAWAEGELDRADLLLNESLRLARRVGSQPTVLMCLTDLGMVASRRRDDTRALDLSAQALEIALSLGITREVAWLHQMQGHVYRQLGDLAAARLRFEEGGRCYAEVGSWDMVGDNLLTLMEVERRAGNEAAADRDLVEGMRLCEAHRTCVGGVSELLGWSVRLVADGDEARALAVRRGSVRIWRRLGSMEKVVRLWSEFSGGHGLTPSLLDHAAFFAGRRDYRTAARIAGAAESAAAALGHELPSLHEDSPVRALLCEARAALGEAAWETARLEGRALTLEEAVEYALQDAEAE